MYSPSYPRYRIPNQASALLPGLLQQPRTQVALPQAQLLCQRAL